MNFWEEFFSTEKIIYPIVSSIGFGLVIKLLFFICNLILDDNFLIAFMLIGFIFGNYIKLLKIRENKDKKE